MGDTGDDYKAMKEHSARKRKNNREQSAAMLAEAGIEYASKNNGAHLIVESNLGKIDFWPGTGKWMCRSGAYSRGVKNLIALVRENSTND